MIPSGALSAPTCAPPDLLRTTPVLHRDDPAVTTLADVPVHRIDLLGAMERIDQFIADGTPHYNVAINAAKVVRFHEDPGLRSAIEEAHLLTADGQAVVWASRLLGGAIPGRVAGADLMEMLLARSAERGYSIYFLGAREEIVQACVDRATRLYPSLSIAGFRNGYFAVEDEPSIVANIRAARPDILFLGFGTPEKEYFMKRHWRALGVPFVMGVGGTFDVFAGLVRRAPRWMQQAGLEWFFRLSQEPRRMWKRYLVGNSRFAALVIRDFATRRAKRLIRQQDER